MRTRPAAVNVFAILNIAFGVMALFGGIFAIATSALKDKPIMKDNPGMRMVHDFPGYEKIMQISIPVNFLGALLLLVSGIGLLKLKPWARGLSIVYGIFAIVQALGLMAAFYFVLLVPVMKQNVDFKDPQAVAPLAGAIGGVFGSCFNLIYPVILLIFMNRRSVIDALRPGTVSAPPTMPQT